MSLQVVLPRIDFTTAGSRTAETAGTGPRTAFHLAGVSLAGVESLMAGAASAVLLVTLNNFGLIVRPSADDISFEGVPYQLSTVA